MPTILTHAVVGASMSALAPDAIPRRRLIVTLLVLPIIPDLDVIAFALEIPYAHPLGHRGFTHSILFAVLLGFGVAAGLFRAVPLRQRLLLGLLCSGATLSHGILDAFTNGGLGVGFFIPFDNALLCPGLAGDPGVAHRDPQLSAGCRGLHPAR